MSYLAKYHCQGCGAKPSILFHVRRPTPRSSTWVIGQCCLEIWKGAGWTVIDKGHHVPKPAKRQKRKRCEQAEATIGRLQLELAEKVRKVATLEAELAEAKRARSE
jgi:hypothetical protein